MDTNVKLLPLAQVAGKEFLVDIESRVFRDFNSPEAVIKMHSVAGRELLEQMKDSDWNGMGISTGRQKDLAV